MSNGQDAPSAVEALSLLREAHDIIAALPSDDPVAAIRQITEALAAINGAGALTLEERYDDISLLEVPMIEHTRLLLREYLNTTRHTRQRESDLWNSAYHCWHELAVAYALCVQQYARDRMAAAGFQKLAHAAAARAIRGLRRQLQWLRVRYAPPPATLWVHLAQIYSQLEPEGVSEEMVIYAGENTTIEREFLKLLALSALTSENLMPLEHDLATFFVNRYANDFVLSHSPDAGCTHSFDLKHPQAPAEIGGAAQPGADLRYFSAGAAMTSLDAALQTLTETQTVPADLGFKTPIEPLFLTHVLKQIFLDWSGKTPARRYERAKTNARVSVVPGFRHIVGVLEQAFADPFDFTSHAVGESWIASDISSDGFGVVMPAVSGDWLTVGSVIGVESEVAGQWSVGMVRRVRRLDEGQQHIGVEVLCRNALAMRVMRDTGASMRITQRMPVDIGILLTADVAHQKEIELLVSDAALFGTGDLHFIGGDIELLVKVEEVLEVTADCARIRFTVLRIEA